MTAGPPKRESLEGCGEPPRQAAFAVPADSTERSGPDMSMTDVVLAIPWATVIGALTLLAGMTLIAAGLRYDREPVRSREDRA